MGHLYPTNISKYMLYKLYSNTLEENHKKTGSCTYAIEPRPLLIYDVIKHFMKQIDRMKFAMKSVKNNNDLIFSEDIEKQEKTIKLLKKLTRQEFGCNAADGSSLESYMIEMAATEVLAYWFSDKIVYKKEDGWYLNLECLKDRNFKELIIDYIDM